MMKHRLLTGLTAATLSAGLGLAADAAAETRPSSAALSLAAGDWTTKAADLDKKDPSARPTAPQSLEMTPELLPGLTDRDGHLDANVPGKKQPEAIAEVARIALAGDIPEFDIAPVEGDGGDRQAAKKAPPEVAYAYFQEGEASWYGPGFYGNPTASGEVFNANELTAAHPSLPFGTQVRVTNLYTGQSTIVRINDRGPYAGGRIIDLSEAAAASVGMIGTGTAPVRLDIVN